MSGLSNEARLQTDARYQRAAARIEDPLPQVELSIEVFPTRTPEAAERLWQNIELFVAAGPRFISVTCGAGGTGEHGTLPLAQGIHERFGLPVAAHLTCAYASRAEIDALLERYWQLGVRGIVALRGDAPKGSDGYHPRADGYPYADALVQGIRALHPFDISVGCYPEIHPDAGNRAADLDYLKRKVDAGANRMVTQYCFDTDRILRFRDEVAAAGIEAELVPGIMPIHSFPQIRRFSLACGAGVPAWLEAMFEGIDDKSPLHGMLAATVVGDQCRRLAAEGLTAMHLYALNRSELPLAIVQLLKAARSIPAAA